MPGRGEELLCVCPPLSAGANCSENALPLMFDGEVFAQYTVFGRPLSSSYEERVSLWLRTEFTDGLLLSLSSAATTSDSLLIEASCLVCSFC